MKTAGCTFAVLVALSGAPVGWVLLGIVGFALLEAALGLYTGDGSLEHEGSGVAPQVRTEHAPLGFTNSVTASAGALITLANAASYMPLKAELKDKGACYEDRRHQPRDLPRPA